MKFVLVIFALIGLAYAAPQPRDLQQDLRDFVDLIPVQQIKAIARRYLDTDAEFQQVIAYLQGPEWAALVAEVAANPTWQEFKAYMLEADLDIHAIIQWISDLITGATPNPVKAQVRGVEEFVDEVLAIVPTNDLLLLLEDKLKNSVEFQAFFEKVSSEKSREFVKTVRALDEVKHIAEVLKDFGIDVNRIIDVVCGILGWE